MSLLRGVNDMVHADHDAAEILIKMSQDIESPNIDSSPRCLRFIPRALTNKADTCISRAKASGTTLPLTEKPSGRRAKLRHYDPHSPVSIVSPTIDTPPTICSSTTASYPSPSPRTDYPVEERLHIHALMAELLASRSPARHTEAKWTFIAEQMQARYGIVRTWASIKMYWSRYGRQASGLDERRVKKPDEMVTGCYTPTSRKLYRERVKEARRSVAKAGKKKRVGRRSNARACVDD